MVQPAVHGSGGERSPSDRSDDLAESPSENRARRPDRGLDGRYRSSGPALDGAISRRREKNRQHRLRRKGVMDGLFEGFVGVFFLVGEKRDWIPQSSRTGPFVSVYEDLIKDAYILGKQERSSVVRANYITKVLLGHHPAEMTRLNARDPSILNGSSSRVRVYGYRRFPSLTKNATEIRPLKEWLKNAESVGALIGTRQQAYEVCVGVIRSYRYVGRSEAGYVGFPLPVATSEVNTPPVASSAGREGHGGSGLEVCPSRQTKADTNGVDGSRSNDSTRVQGSCDLGNSSTVQTDPGTGTDNPRSGTAVVSQLESVSGESNRRMLRYMLHYLDLVYCDDLFMALCMVFDERFMSMFHIIVGAFRQKFINKRPNVPYLVRCLMDYSRDKAFGVRNQHEHEQREKCLRSARDNFAKVRILYGLKGYEEMRWDFPVDQPVDRN